MRLFADLRSPLHLFPVPDPADYFGEKVALYFGWLGLYSTFLLYAAAPGFICFLTAIGQNRTDNALTPVFACFMALWGSVFLLTWKRREKQYAMEWGMVGFETAETTRPAYVGDIVLPGTVRFTRARTHRK